ncbi:subtilisin family serine protease [Saccharothrix tamanrassetensis]|uniref:Subtilisin family serine protease n=1 Tax=Saccharothrix tamanrassetensis TaxID=1051531 RepID=A0A841CSL3_9PSEU|nr:S8 family serine peptidase [Saccharothrix tamanrassetensis]MBB5959314.1 subtilisin family serine protease [Saccharothrix tamanrassetensis]
MSESSNRPELYERAFEQAIREHKDLRLHAERGREFLFVARELLTIPEDVDRVSRKLRDNRVDNERGRDFAGMVRLVLPRNPDEIPNIVRLLRDPRQWPGERVPFVQPHHAVVGHGGNMHGHPGQPPHVGTPLADPPKGSEGRGKGVVVGILDTGISKTAATDHPAWLGGAFVPKPDEVDAAYAHDDVFALEGGHGTFVAGVVRQAAPGVRFDPEKVLDPSGLGTEEDFARALSSFDEQVHIVNVSLGCFTQDDVASEPIRRALLKLPKSVVVVASAGNQGTNRPSWPAALPDVVGVAAIAEELDGTRAPACYSNFGHWVKACAIGNRTSTYLKGRWVLPGDPAVDVYDRWAYWLGTSFAAPHVAGRIAETMTTHGLSATAARDKLLTGAPFFPGYGILVD